MLEHVTFEMLLLIILLLLSVPLLGNYMAKIFQGEKTWMHIPFGWLETASYKVANIDPSIEMSWKTYVKSLFIFNGLGGLLLFVILITQDLLPLNPQYLPALSVPLALNITISFVTNTNWQSYAGETTLSYFSQMVGLTTQNFLSAATGVATFLALVRGLVKNTVSTLGNFWVDMVRSIVYILLPFSLVYALILVSQGVIQNLSPYQEIETLEEELQVIPGGAVASQVAIKQLGTNGGGVFSANGAHPFENPSGITNFLETFAILLIPAAFPYAYGVMIRSKRHGWLIFAVMLSFWLVSLCLSLWSALIPNPLLASTLNYEGIETRFGISNSLLWTVSTTTTANGSVNSALTSRSPLAGGMALFNMLLGGLIFGGIGIGLCHMIMFIILTVFMAGLMVGRTPQYLGKRIEKTEISWTMLTILIPGVLILLGSGLSSILPIGSESTNQRGPHGLTEIAYAFASTASNNGSAFAGLNSNNNYYNIILALIMLTTRFTSIISSIALAGTLAQKRAVPVSVGTFSTDTKLFAVLLSCIILIVGALTFFPLLSSGPIVEHLLMMKGVAF